MKNNGILTRIKSKARANQLSIALGSDWSGKAAIPELAQKLEQTFGVNAGAQQRYEYYRQWNQLVDLLESKVSREELHAFIVEEATSIPIQQIHRKLACIPISNFIDLTFDRGLLQALIEAGKKPVVHAFLHQSMGAWRQSNPDEPNVFFSFAQVHPFHHWFGLHEQLCHHPQNRIQIENMMEMLRQKDLLLLGISSFEAEGILHLEYLAKAADKVVNTVDPVNDYRYWTRRGVFLADVETMDVVDDLLPTNLKSYSFWDLPIPNRMLIDIAREKGYDCFISYFSGDKAFAQRVDADLHQRGIHIWRDSAEIEVGDSISDKIEHALKRSYTFLIVLSKEALARPWVREELRAAYTLRHAESLKILPLLYKDCEIPLFLADYKYADFREEKNYSEQLELLARSIGNSIKRARGKM
jgi:hypothetical protein